MEPATGAQQTSEGETPLASARKGDDAPDPTREGKHSRSAPESGPARPTTSTSEPATAAAPSPDVDPWDETPVTVPRGLLAVLLEAGIRADEKGLLGKSCPNNPCPTCTALCEIHDVLYPIEEVEDA
jgi:hypothetical protein